MATLKHLLLSGCLLLGLTGRIAGAESAPTVTSATDLKAVFLFQFSQFVTWPEAAFPTRDAPFVVGILGRDPFGTALDTIVSGESAAGHPIIVRRLRTAAEARDCHILFVAPDSERDFAAANLRKQPVLTIGETEAFARVDGMIRFALVQNRVRLRLNMAPVRAAGLTLSSKLLRIAEKTENATP